MSITTVSWFLTMTARFWWAQYQENGILLISILFSLMRNIMILIYGLTDASKGRIFREEAPNQAGTF